jgi:dihydrolipoamide dehydrogenase
VLFRSEVSDFLSAALKKQGMDIRPSTGVQKITETGAGLTAEIKAKGGTVTTEEFSHVIVAVGIVPNVENIGLETLGIEPDKRFHIKTDAMCRTNVPGVYAIGDVTAPPWLAHKASHEGVIAAEAIAQALGNTDVHPHTMNPLNIPGCTYCHPQIASVGLTEAKAKDAGYKVRVGKFPFIGNGKAIALGEAEGFIKTVFDEATGELLGAHMIGAEVTELIQGYTIGKQAELVEQDFMQTVFPHPTLSEMMHESVLGAYGKALHF